MRRNVAFIDNHLRSENGALDLPRFIDTWVKRCQCFVFPLSGGVRSLRAEGVGEVAVCAFDDIHAVL